MQVETAAAYGTTEGKRWRRRWPYMDAPGVNHEWHMGEYGPPEGNEVPIIWRSIFITSLNCDSQGEVK